MILKGELEEIFKEQSDITRFPSYEDPWTVYTRWTRLRICRQGTCGL